MAALLSCNPSTLLTLFLFVFLLNPGHAIDPGPSSEQIGTMIRNQHSSSAALHEADPSTGVPCPHGAVWGMESQAKSVGGCQQLEIDYARRARNNRLRGYVSGSWDPTHWRARMDNSGDAGRSVGGGPDCKACAHALLGAGILSEGDDNLDDMRTKFKTWAADANNKQMQMESESEPNAKQHNHDVRQCFEAFVKVDCDFTEFRR